jgi:hypothetical protein
LIRTTPDFIDLVGDEANDKKPSKSIVNQVDDDVIETSDDEKTQYTVQACANL